MAFLDRQYELSLLLDHVGRDGGALFVLYGRRRVGKTALLEEVVSRVAGAAYHVATRSTVVEELGRLSRTLARAWQLPLLEAQPLTSVEALLALLEGLSGPRVLVLDELPYLIESAPSLPGLLQASWDRALSRQDLKLVVCGSSVSMMEETFLLPRAPLFGRRTGQLRLGPLPISSLAQVFGPDPRATLEVAALFGTVPGYVLRLDPSAGLEANLESRLLRRGEPLYEEVPFLLREELREPRVYHAILATIAGGAERFGEISSKVGLDRANLSRYLGTLVELGLVRRETPVTEVSADKSRKGLYRIVDPFVATWFAYVHPNRDRLERGRSAEVMEQQVRPTLPVRLGRAVEAPLAELLAEDPAAHGLPFEPSHLGRYWSATAELDVVLLDERRERAFVAEVKWSSRRVSPKGLEALRARVLGEAAFSGLEVTFALVSRQGFTAAPRLRRDERLIDVRSLEL